MAAVSLLVQKFNSTYAKRPILTTMMTNAVLGGIADTTAQLITSIRQKAIRRPAGPNKDDFLTVEIHELDGKIPWPPGELIPASRNLPPPFDFERLARFVAFGLIMAPLQLQWYSVLNKAFPLTKTSGTIAALKRVACDQLIYAPIGLGVFFTFMTLAEGGGKRAVQRKFRDIYVPTLKANYILWPAVQMINFRLLPLQFQIPFVSTIGIAWTAYLSMSNASDNA